MLRGDLNSNPLRKLLPELAADAPTGCVYVADPQGGELHLYLDEGRLAAVRPAPAGDPLGARLIATRQLGTDEVEAHRPSDDRHPSLAERLLDANLLGPADLERLSLELALDVIDVACGWTVGAFRFRRRQRAPLPLAAPMPVDELLASLARREEERGQLVSSFSAVGALGEVVPDPAHVRADHAVPLTLRVYELVDGGRSIADIARLLGHSDLTVGRLLATMSTPAAESGEAELPDERSTSESWNRIAADDEVVESLAKLSVALNDVLGDATLGEEPSTANSLIRLSAGPAGTSQAFPPVDPETAARRERLRAAAAAELAAAHAEAEEARRAYEASLEVPAPSAEVVDLTARREAARARVAEGARLVGPVASPTLPDQTGPVERPWDTTPSHPQAWQQPATDDHLSATALLREMAGGGSGPAAPSATPAAGELRREPADASQRTGIQRPSGADGSADTAALLRELSSLGEEPPLERSSDRPTRPSRPAAGNQAAARKRKGLWGRS